MKVKTKSLKLLQGAKLLAVNKVDSEVKKIIGKELITSEIQDRPALDRLKRRMAKKYHLPCPKNSELLKIYHEITGKGREQKKPILELLLRKRPVRSLSGVVNVSVLTKSYPCPGKCIFCPNEKNIPKSYLKNEPAVQRAIINKFHPYRQTQSRLKALKETGHPIDKVELRIIGGTWSYYSKQYQEWFVSECFRACNQQNHKPETINHKSQELKVLQKKNEGAKCRVVGIAVETRPDYINLEEIKRMRELGITKVELGVQSVYDNILKLNRRGHNVAATIQATRLLKNAGFKISYQIMPGLLGSDVENDSAMFREIFTNPDFKPDYLKIYPLALVKNTKLYQKYYRQGSFKPYSSEELIEIITEAKKQIPYWCRVERIIRDIPSQDIIEGGSRVLNLREVVVKKMEKFGWHCQCIRCREVGAGYNPGEKIYLFRENYEASGAKEIFLSFENKKRTKLYALLRLRFPRCQTSVRHVSDTSLAPASALPVLKNTAIIREIHTYGQMAEIKRVPAPKGLTQHKGFGKKLIEEAEKIAKDNGYKKIAVISGIGARDYFRKLSYRLQNTYMIKRLIGK